MTHNSEQQPAPPQSEEFLRVTFRRDTTEFEITPDASITPDLNYPGMDYTGDQEMLEVPVTYPSDLQVYRSLTPTTNARVLKELTQLYLATGPGEYEVHEVATAAGIVTPQAAKMLQRIQKFLPPDVLHIDNSPRIRHRIVTFGNLALATAIADVRPAEKTRRDEMFYARANVDEELALASETEMQELRRVVVEAEEAKRHLFDYDHAVVTFAGKEAYTIQFDSMEGILLMRFIHALKKAEIEPIATPTGEYRRMHFSAIRDHVWSQMPLAERRLVTNDPAVLYGTSSNIIDLYVRHVWRKFSKIEINGEKLMHNARDHVRFTNRPIQASYSAEPVAIYEPPVMEIPLFPKKLQEGLKTRAEWS